jgi:hypothetical protein
MENLSWPTIQKELLETHFPPIPFFTDFRYNPDSGSVEFNIEDRITILSISTGPGDYELELIRKLGLPVCLIIIDPFITKEFYLEKFRGLDIVLYVNPFMPGFVWQEFEQYKFPQTKKTFTAFEYYIQYNLQHISLVFIANYQFSASSVLKHGHNPSKHIILDYRQQNYQDILQGLKPNPKEKKKWILEGTDYYIDDSALSNSILHRYIWRYYKSIQNKETIPVTLIYSISRDRFSKGFFQKSQKKSIIITNFQEFYDYFKSRKQSL